MSTKKLYEAISLIDDSLIDEAGAYAPPKKKVVHWKRWTALAACLVVVIGVGGAFLSQLGGLGGNTGASAEGSGADGGSTFMSYAGPVFPLTTLDDAAGITAQRDITLDFAPWVPAWLSNEEMAAEHTDLTEEERQEVLADYNEWFPDGGYYQYSDDILVTDTYTLTNDSSEDKTLSLLYPFVSSLSSLDERTPTLTADGTELDATLRIGSYTGGFQGVLGGGGGSERETVNLDHLTGWEGYKVLLENGAYLEKALSDLPDFSGTTAVVYQFTDAWAEPGNQDAPNPSLRVTFELDYDKTTVLSYGFHSASWDPESGFMGQGFSIREPGEADYGEPYYLIILGDDIEDMETQAYVTGGWDTKKKLDDFGVSIERYETDLDAILRQVVGKLWNESMGVDFETYYGLYCDWLLTYGVLAEDGGMDRYDNGWLNSLDVSFVDRVCYLDAEVTIPAGGSVILSAVMTKDASYDYYCAHTENQGVNGYDMVTQLGSTLTFTGQTATLIDHAQIEIVRQNFGFDPERGITTVNLDMNTEHYYLEVKRSTQTENE